MVALLLLVESSTVDSSTLFVFFLRSHPSFFSSMRVLILDVSQVNQMQNVPS